MNDQALLDPHSTLREFLAQSDFMRHGAVMTDLDGTAVVEENGRAYVSVPMETGLKRMHDLRRAVVINSLRFPLSIIRTFGKAWYQITGAPVPVVVDAWQPVRPHGADKGRRNRLRRNRGHLPRA